MPGRLQGRVVVVTGAASGIGRATALLATSEGASVGLIDVDGDGLDATAALVRSGGGRVELGQADVTELGSLGAALDALAGALGPFDGVVANAAILPPPVPTAELDWREWDRVVAVNLTGAMATLVLSLGHVVDGGSLLVTGSSMAIRPRPQRLAYVAAKAGLHGAARALALELADRRIRVNVLAPGLTDTPMVRRVAGHIESGLPSVPLGELVAPDEVASMAVQLLSDDARHVTGAVVSLDGGRTVG